MSGDRRKINKQCTGTVPKIKYRNNTSSAINEGNNSQRSLTNNLTSNWQRTENANFVRNSRRNTFNSNYYTMDGALEDVQNQTRQNTTPYMNANMNGTTPMSSTSTSRRNSSSTVPKCDNVSKYPDKKQVEDKLNQIREYLKITTSLMSSMKLSDEQSKEDECNDLAKMIADLKDSESKLVVLCQQMNEDEHEQVPEVKENGVDTLSEAGSSASHSVSHKNELERIEQTNKEIDSLKEQQLALLHLQQKAENKLRQARNAQERLLTGQRTYVNNITNVNEKNFSELDETIKQFEERARRRYEPSHTTTQISQPEKALFERVDALQNQITSLHNANDERQQLIEVLDNRDAELRSEHLELQSKLVELQKKKRQVDELVLQLQYLDSVDDDDVGGQVKKIVSMKEQLSKLKDMLEIVQNTETIMQNQSNTPEEQAIAYDICTKAENFLQNNTDIQKQSVPSESNFSLCYDNNTTPSHNEHRQKQVNRAPCDRQGARPKQSAIDEKLSVHAELEAKKRELESIMGKHKAGTSNLNHDVGSDHKTDFFDAINEQWISANQQNSQNDRYSSDEEEAADEYSEPSPSRSQVPTFSVSSDNRHRQESVGEYVQPAEYERLQSSITCTPERNIRAPSVSNYDASRDRRCPNVAQENNKNKVQEQLELIKTVCDSMLEQSSNIQQSNVQQLRNNLTPSPIYSEPRRFASPNPHSMNALNVVNANGEFPWMVNGNPANPPADIANYQNWLAANTLQSQAFMLNTLNQCCQMLWLQQRDLTALRTAVTTLQERLDQPQPYVAPSQLVSPMQQPHPVDPRPPSNQYRCSNQQKANQVSAACSMPNLNHYNLPPANPHDLAYHPANVQSARLLDSCLNNIAHLNSPSVDCANNMVHANQVWNGQALNNQVAPGNRANNYWDNFRSYSRQNLLSTKSNEGLHNFTSPLDRVNNASHPFALVAPSKSNSEQESGSTSQENTPRRQANVAPKRRANCKKVVIPPPDVLNINHNIGRPEEQTDVLPENNQVVTSEEEQGASYRSYHNAFEENEPALNCVKITGDHILKDCIPENCRRRNEWHDDVENEQQLPKSKLFEELRENVYREVATLISANEARPHFLIQLFRDLQMISSDTLRLKILQSIQGVITHSTHNVSTQASNTNQTLENGTATPNEYFSLQSTVWSKQPRNANSSKNASNLEESDMHDTLKEIIPFINDHEDEIIQPHFLMGLKQMLVNSESFQEIVKDSIFQKHFSNVLDDVLEQFIDKKVKDVKVHLMHTLSDILRGELSFIQLIQETCPENCENAGNAEVASSSLPFISNSVFEFRQQEPPNRFQPVNNTTTPIENGDLAEADQSRVEDEEMEEEGAVGGFLDVSQEHASGNLSLSNTVQVSNDDIDLPTIDFPGNIEQPESQFVKQGLDQVPTRLACRSKSRSNTPSRDRSSSSRSEHHSDHF